jgi:sugar transferase (PEP-CTERM/EpsH1 system associated)
LSVITVGHTIYAFKDGGMEQGLLNIINHGDASRFRHVVLCLTEAGAFTSRLRAPACRVVELHKRDGNDCRLPGRIAGAVRQHGVNILHARGWPTLVETALAARLVGVRSTVYGFHGKTLEELRGTSLTRRCVQKLMVRDYSRVMTLNCRMRAELAYECGLPESRISIIANGVDVDRFRPREDRSALRAMLGLPESRFIIGSVGRLDPVKNHEVILRAIHRLREQGRQAFLLLVGEGPQRPVLEREIKHLRLEQDVCMFGFSHQIPELLNCMDVYVQSSFYEGFSNTVLEAMACGLPVLVTNVGGTPDLLNEETGGFFFRPDDDEHLASVILLLQQDSSQRLAMAHRARHRVVQDFFVQRMVHDYQVMYSELAGNCSTDQSLRARPLSLFDHKNRA